MSLSLTCDLETSEIWVHWREENQHHMELVNKSSLRQLSEIENTRNILRNIVEHSLGERLDNIKKALPSFAAVWAQGGVPTIPQVDCTAASMSSAPSKFQFTFPMTPSSLGSGSVLSEPIKKRRLDGSVNTSDG
ncbi:hypothetical protein GQ44DRAFT_779992 [Phaeosphaeriaceae sp. PMI808]|nr:hypothetical protein GQ44DRAFT_779992 [Phaeosphaeriaceae sp. PMI808]